MGKPSPFVLPTHHHAICRSLKIETRESQNRTAPQLCLDVSALIVRSASAQSQRKGAIAPCSWAPEESQVQSCEHQGNANIHCQPFPESVSKEHEIYTDYDGCDCHQVKHDSYLSAHGSLRKWF
jgi:hypothetical protein